MPEPTPGEIAYTAYMRKVHGCCPWPWRGILEASRAGWEAAALAVLTQAGLLVLDLDPEETRDV